MKKILILIGIIAFYNYSYSQEDKSHTCSVFRVNFINPSFDYEIKIKQELTFSINLGVGYGGAYKNLTTSASGWLYMYSPFLDFQFKHFHNLENRVKKGRSTDYNSGNFLGVKFFARGKAIESNFTRTNDFDYLVGPMWGMQRSYRRIHILFDIGFNYYFDSKGNDGFTPMVELNIGYDLFYH